MEKKKYKLKGHESFILRDGWITKGLRAVRENKHLFWENAGADALGVGTNMAKSIRYWMKTANLIKENSAKGVFLTEIGEIIAENDLYIEDVFSLWIIHCNITCDFGMATSWNIFFNNINVTSAFSREELCQMIKELIIENIGDIEPSERSIRDDCAAILSMYTMTELVNDDPEEKKISPFEELGLIGKTGNKFFKKRPFLDKIDPLIVQYLILDKLNSEKSLPIDDIVNGYNMPGKIMNLNRIIVNELLDALQQKKYIIVNRTAGLDIVYPNRCKNITKEDILREYYERKRNL